MAASIFELVTSVQLGGAENVAFALAQHGRDGRGGKIVVVELFRTHSDYAQRKRADLAAQGIRVITLSPFGKRASLLLAPFALAWQLWQERPALVHSHTDLPDLVLSVVLRAGRALRLPLPAVLRTVHNVMLWPTHPRLGRFVEAAFVGDHIVAVSNAALAAYVEMRQRFGLPLSHDRATVYNGCRQPQPRPLPYPLPSDRVNIAFCGRFDLQKGVDVLAGIVRAVQAAHPGRFAFHLFGAGPLQPMLAELAATTEAVGLHEPLAGIADHLHAFNYLIMPSRFEGLPLVAIESALAGVAVIATRAPGLEEALPDGWPLVFRLDDPVGVQRIFDDIEAGRLDQGGLVRRASAHALARFSLDAMVNAYDERFARLALVEPPRQVNCN